MKTKDSANSAVFLLAKKVVLGSVDSGVYLILRSANGHGVPKLDKTRTSL